MAVAIQMPPRRPAGLPHKVIYIDGNNLMMQRKVTKGRVQLAEKVSGLTRGDVFLVFDGKPGEEFQMTGTDPCVVVTAGGVDGEHRVSADEWIMQQLKQRALREAKVEVVTADRMLRHGAHQVSAKTINPVKWWRRYLPRLKGLKSDYSNTQRAP
eukprot:CAMPEP_0119329300 /NCGR_PEP_ID=MMETSP1333-20130426/75514_1 /TAXON_ID=418940 /ORGANISM="Scyphosphaera apsteinii, Strain RCC1455" /LENGTH=154 /DNA_ID=CAMNT_0007338383 /DNA_START=65 /DNA_END=529 /DNA_ORIENTATION=-